MADVNSMNKDELADFAKSEFNVDLNKRNSLETLRDEVNALIASNTSKTTVSDVPDNDNIEYLLNPKTGVVFQATEHLKINEDLVPCDKDGNRL